MQYMSYNRNGCIFFLYTLRLQTLKVQILLAKLNLIHLADAACDSIIAWPNVLYEVLYFVWFNHWAEK